MTNLKEIMEIADKGYYDSFETIDGILNELSSRKMGEIFDQVKPEIKNVFDIVTQLHDMPGSVLDLLTFTDFICLMIDTEDRLEEEEIGDETSPEQIEMLLVNAFKQCLLDAGKTDMLIREFLGINVDSFMHYLEDKHNDHEVFCLYSDLLEDSDKVFSKDAYRLLRKEMNIGDCLENTLETEKLSWKCWQDIKEYEQVILAANAMDRKLIVDAFSFGYRERMNVEDLLEIYTIQDDFPMDEWEDFEDYFEGGENYGENN